MIFRVDVFGLASLKQQIDILRLPLAQRRRLLRKTSQAVLRDSRQRIRTQTDLQGKPFKQRWRKRSDRRKMLSRLIKLARVLRNDGKQALIGFARGGVIAARQQFGYIQTITANALQRDPANRQQPDKPATKRQAVELKKLGYRLKKGGRKPSLRYIMNNLSVAQAGAIIRSMREQQGERTRTSWRTVLPARAFLGASADDVARHIQTIFSDILKEIPRGTR